MRNSFLVLLLPFMTAACTGDYVSTSFNPAPGAQIKPNENASAVSSTVRVFSAPPAEPYQIVGKVRADGSLSNRDEEFLVRLKLEAAKVGANGIIIEEQAQSSLMDMLTFSKPKSASALAIKTDLPKDGGKSDSAAMN